ncbi:unnamed protein product [Penicillium salamii]|uniref:T6SS Phospholipase effector Tle1-like catalytic domain-containing protein n=1 Tax=Penicillium salamii TaxID=1612424 RepID=A0A9W4ID66_9EURO|nr:unnamed protein product [Penicillium salamii]
MSLCSEGHDVPYIIQQRRDAKLPPIRKRIIICCDGTWQSAVSGKRNVPSNVTRLCRAMNSIGTDDDGNEWQQLVWYDSGIGTTSLALGEKIQGAIGQGLEGNIVEAYNFCVLNYNPGDQIMCFGFSRGAFTARAIAGLISDIGICNKHDLNRFPDLWKVYKKNKPGERFYCSDLWFEWMEGKADEKQGAKGDEFKFSRLGQGDWAQEGSRNVEVVGVYDTVGSIGMPALFGMKLPKWLTWWSDQSGWENVDLSANIKHAYQALALDEHRDSFSPTLWYLPNYGEVSSQQVVDQKKVKEKKEQEWKDILEEAKKLKKSGKASDEDINSAARHLNRTAKLINEEARKLVKMEDDCRHRNHPRTLRQVWFPGYHVNIGGGSDDSLRNEGDMEEMSSITFAWMLDQIKPHLSLDEEYLVKERTDMEFYISELGESMEQKEKSWAQKTWATLKSPFQAAVPTAIKERRYGWGTGELADSFTPFFYLNGSKRRTPGYDYTNSGGIKLADTCEYVHPVVGFRKQAIPSYAPLGKGSKYERRKAVSDTGCPLFEYTLGKSLKSLPEWPLGGLDSYERLFIASKAAYDYVDELDLHLKTGIKTPRRSVWGIRDIDLGIQLPTVTAPNGERSEQNGSSSNAQEEARSKGLEAKRAEWTATETAFDEQVIHV